MRVTRRRFLRLGGLLGAGLVAPGCADPRSGAARATGDKVSFTHGVASGDPLADRAILWTRALPADAGTKELPVRWQAARDAGFLDVVAAGEAFASAARDFTVKVDAALPDPDTYYWYRFEAGGAVSPAGRTRTAPAGDVAAFRFVATTCSNPNVGHFNTLACIAALDDLRFVMHLGDYIYEYGSDAWDPPHACVTLDDYRRRYAYYRAFPEQLEAHRLHPWIIVYDDGEFANGCWTYGAEAHDPQTQGAWEDRRRAAAQAFEEWTPTRLAPQDGDIPRLYRRLAFGAMADVLMLDLRQDARDGFLSDHYVTGNIPAYDDPARRIMSPAQMGWLLDGLADRRSRWKLVGNQAMLGHWGGPGAPDLPPEAMRALGLRQNGNQLYVNGWNGYPADRRRLYAGMQERDVQNLVVLSGDAHYSFAMDLPPDPFDATKYDPVTGRSSLGVEFVVPSVNSEAFPETMGYPPRTLSLPVERASLAGNPHHKYTELDSKGYTLVTLTAERAVAEYWFMRTVLEPGTERQLGARLVTAAGSNRVDLTDYDPLAGS